MKALSDLIVLDLTHMLAGPFGAMLLADLGATTIKVEPPGKGEATRRLLENDPKHSLNGVGAYFLTLNRNKKSVVIDLKSPDGLALFYELARKADVVFSNFGPGVNARLGIDHDTLAAHNPRIITCSVSGFGETGPGTNRPAFDMVAQGYGGGMSITGFPGAPPTKAGIPIGDLGGGIFGTLGILAALHARERTGRGQHVDISMQDCQISLLTYMATMYLLSGEEIGPMGNTHFRHIPYNTYPTKDRHIILACVTDQAWCNVASVINDPELADPGLAALPARTARRDWFEARLAEALKKQNCDYWLARFAEANVPAAPVNDFGHALSDPQALARNMVVNVPQPAGGAVRMPGNPIKLSETGEESFAPSPALGQHTDEVLRGLLGKSEAEVAGLRARSIVQ
ncbi:MAG: CoA transferase [Alphaproteobacteria bacterium]|nr:CoA transferase [Alphaproteobacteria bacterium]